MGNYTMGMRETGIGTGVMGSNSRMDSSYSQAYRHCVDQISNGGGRRAGVSMGNQVGFFMTSGGDAGNFDSINGTDYLNIGGSGG